MRKVEKKMVKWQEWQFEGSAHTQEENRGNPFGNQRKEDEERGERGIERKREQENYMQLELLQVYHNLVMSYLLLSW